MDPEELFLRRLDELERIIDVADPYEMLKASAILRQLLIDGGALANQVKPRDLKLSFVVADHREFLAWAISTGKVNVWSSPDAIGPAMGVGKKISELKLDQFLKQPVAYRKPHTYTVRDIIQTAANALGGVHNRGPENDKEERLFGASRPHKIEIQGVDLALYQLRGIAKVVLKALQPLREEVQKVRPSHV